MGIFIMVFSTYGSLYPMEESTNATSMITNNLLDKVNPPLNIIKNLPIIPDSNNLEHIPRANGIMLLRIYLFLSLLSLWFHILFFTDKINKRKINKVVSAAKDVNPVLPKPKLKSVIMAKKQSVVKSDKTAAGILVPKVKEIKVETVKTLNENLYKRAIAGKEGGI